MRAAWLKKLVLSWLFVFAGGGGADEIEPFPGLGPAGAGSGGVGPTDSGGTPASGGGTAGTGGQPGSGGTGGSGGSPPTGGLAGTGGGTTGGAGTGGGPAEIDCNAAMPTSGAQQHSGNGRGGSGNLAWEIWSNVGTGNLTTYDVPAFSASWNNSGDYLGRLGYEWGGWGSTPRPYAAYGTITAQFAYRRTGTGGGYSYFGIYGWSTDPCVEWYIVDDSFNGMPVNPGNTVNKGEVELDGGTYIMYTRSTQGTGGSRCSSSITTWDQYYSIRKTARQCGQISITRHFDAWRDLGMPLGNLLEAKILVETGGGSGTAEFPIAKVTATNP